MASRQDQLHSYQFSARRVVAALVLREPDAAQSPGRRLAGATFAGLVVAALSLAAVTVYGLVRPGNSTDWRRAGTVVVENGSGAKYVYLDDGKLHPVLNYASALLLAGPDAHTARVAAASLSGTPRGAVLGIPGAPDSLPGKESLRDDAWHLCSARLSGTVPQSVLYVGTAPDGGKPLGDNGILAGTPDGTQYLLWHGSALRIPQPHLVSSAFSWGGEPVTVVAPALIDAVGAGPDLVPPPVPDAGRDSALPGFRVGTVLVSTAQGGAKQYGVVLAAGLAPISQVQADLLLADPALADVVGSGGARAISQAQYAQAPVAALPQSPDALPRNTPALSHPASALCATAPGDAAATLTVDATLTGAADAAPAGGAGAGGGRFADRIVVPPGHGALVEAAASSTATGGALCLVTDVGRRYPLVNADVAGLLGYPGLAPVRVPSALVSLVPAGPVLDPAAARQPS